jgi:trigger factor
VGARPDVPREELGPVGDARGEVADGARVEPRDEALGAGTAHGGRRYRPARMANDVKATVTELPESRVRVVAEISPSEVEKRLEHAARSLGRELRVPGFRRGKVPAPVVIRRVGREAVLDEAVRESLGRWYADAIDAAGIVPVGDPDVDMPGLPDEGEPLTFSVEIGVRPTAKLGRYRGLEVGRREPDVSDEAIDAEIEQLRERLAKLDTADREANEGDFVVMDYRGTVDGEVFAGGEGTDQLIELGSGRLIPGFEEQLTGARAGEDREVRVTFPSDYQAEHLAGQEAVFAVSVKEVKEKTLPPVDDQLAVDGAGFDSLDELKEDIRTRLADREQDAIAGEFREAVLDAVAAEAEIDVPDSLTHARAHELWDQTMRQLQRQGISKEMYLQMAGRPEDEIVHEAMPEAEKALKREAVLAAVVEAEGIEPTEDEVLEEVEHVAEQEGVKAKKLLEQLKSANRLEAFKEDLATRRAAEFLAEEATPVELPPEEAAEDAEKAAAQPASGKLWTPGS